ncbi:MAG: hypothetical protein ACLTXT_01850 [Ruminococcus callidus]
MAIPSSNTNSRRIIAYPQQQYQQPQNNYGYPQQQYQPYQPYAPQMQNGYAYQPPQKKSRDVWQTFSCRCCRW